MENLRSYGRKFGHIILNGELFAAMDGTGNHTFCFNEAVSLVVACKNQEEIDYYWNQLRVDPEISKRVMLVVLKSKKLITRDMENA